ncbi:hypothetical protein, partial [uncultured Fibrobacter sp.]|uniref:hypothetical protein n=1 Tax=uncultured Fibrobacter sp. TaxID=261512 RepID=UPI0025D65FC9
PWALFLIQAFAVVRLIPRFRPFATVPADEPSTLPSGEPSTLQAVGVPLDPGFCRGSTDTKV